MTGFPQRNAAHAGARSSLHRVPGTVRFTTWHEARALSSGILLNLAPGTYRDAVLELSEIGMLLASAPRMGAHNLQELAAFRLCEELMKTVEAETAKDPIARQFRFCDQLNDAALDAASDVAEGFVRYYPGDFARFLDFAISSLQEVRVRTEAAHRRKLLAVKPTSDILNLWARADRACRNLRTHLWNTRKEDLPPRPNRTRPNLRKRRLPRPLRPKDPPSESP